jgi:hypothetical protein
MSTETQSTQPADGGNRFIKMLADDARFAGDLAECDNRKLLWLAMSTKAWMNLEVMGADAAILAEVESRLYPEYDGDKVKFTEWGWDVCGEEVRYVSSEKPLPSAQPVAESPWRALEPGEIIQEGDEFNYPEQVQPWKPVGHTIGLTPSQRGYMIFRTRRPLPSTQPAAESPWRPLEPGEIIQEGDEIELHDGRWSAQTMCTGQPNLGSVPFRTRRPLPSAQPATGPLGHAWRECDWPERGCCNSGRG